MNLDEKGGDFQCFKEGKASKSQAFKHNEIKCQCKNTPETQY